ncbi:hypothetical protein KAJ38_03065 [Candidatus Pacearchaeota archaeon]|nr:hypothetical protein [Candidatus Pacearchaeota archaeon]
MKSLKYLKRFTPKRSASKRRLDYVIMKNLKSSPEGRSKRSASKRRLNNMFAEGGRIGEIVKIDCASPSPRVNKIYSLRDSLIKDVNAGLISHGDLEDFIRAYSGTPEAGLVTTVRYLTAKGFKDMAWATDMGFGERYGFLACTGEINDLRKEQGMFADHLDYAEGFSENSGQGAIGTKFVKNSRGNSFRWAKDTGYVATSMGRSFNLAKGTQFVGRSLDYSFEQAQNTQYVKGSYGNSFKKAKNTEHVEISSGRSFEDAENTRYIETAYEDSFWGAKDTQKVMNSYHCSFKNALGTQYVETLGKSPFFKPFRNAEKPKYLHRTLKTLTKKYPVLARVLF